MGFLSEAFDKLKDGIKDVSSLEVMSFSGDINVVINDKNAIDWEKLLETSQTQGNVNLMLASEFKADGDAMLFAASSEIDENIRKAHAEAIIAGQKVRNDLMALFTDVIKAIPGAK